MRCRYCEGRAHRATAVEAYLARAGVAQQRCHRRGVPPALPAPRMPSIFDELSQVRSGVVRQ